MSYMFILDKRKCVGCSACAVACMDQNDIDVTAGDRPFRQCFTLESGQTVRLLYILFEYSVRDSDEVLYGVLFFEDPDDALRETATAIIYAAAGCIWTIYW